MSANTTNSKSEEKDKISNIITASSSTAFNSTGECIKPLISLEFFPPRTEKGLTNLRERMKKLSKLKPAFADFTWGAGGSTSELTFKLSMEAKDNCDLIPNMHLTCTNMPRSKIDEVLEDCFRNGVRNIVALRGDPPLGTDRWEASEEGFKCALDLVRYIRAKYGSFFCISVAGYPEGDPESISELEGGANTLSASEKTRYHLNEISGKTCVCTDEKWAKELAYLKSKCDAGADVIITQMFFDSKVYEHFVHDCRKVGITVPIVPGIMFLNTFAGFEKMTALCKTRVPDDLKAQMNTLKGNDDSLKEFGIQFGTEMCKDLLKMGAPVLHFYTLNLEKATLGVLENLNLLDKEVLSSPKA